MKKIRLWLSVLLALGGIFLGLYIGIWVMFIGGIMGIANAWDLETITATLLAWNIIKIVLAYFVGNGIITISLIISESVGDI